MHPASAAEALGRHTDIVRKLLIQTVQYRHDCFAEAHAISRSRYGNGFGAQWRDLLDDMAEVFKQRGYRTLRLMPAGYKLPIVNNCLVYVWRMPESSRGVEAFASSQTRVNVFSAVPPHPVLFEPDFGDADHDAVTHHNQFSELTGALEEAIGAAMPLILVVVYSSPRQLQKIEWGVGELDVHTGEVSLSGQETLWVAEPKASASSDKVASFDSGVPTPPMLELRKEEGVDNGAR